MEILDWNKKQGKIFSYRKFCALKWMAGQIKKILKIIWRHIKHEINTDRQCLFWGYRFIVPEILQEKVLKEILKCHFGIVKMKEIPGSCFWRRNLDKVIDLVRSG